MAGYSGTPLATKLGIRTGSTVAVINPPDHFHDLLPDIKVRRQVRGPLDMVLLFTDRRAELSRRIEQLGGAIFPGGAIWIAWPKKASKVPTDITEDTVREVALPLGLVDTKVCAIDDTWSGLKLVWRKENRRP